jgi:hypothetical protein
MDKHTPQIPLFTTAPNDPTLEIPYGYCHCGCGQKTNLMPHTDKARGWIKGNPYLFLHGHNHRAPLHTRFWRLVAIAEPDQCWLWRGAISWNGYGAVRGEGGNLIAHRASWILTFGPIPNGLCVLHRCDNRPCVNPTHLFLGTQKDNLDDMWSKNRGSRLSSPGELSGTHKLVETDIPVIRDLFLQGITYGQIAERFGVCAGTIGRVIRRESWSHVA